MGEKKKKTAWILSKPHETDTHLIQKHTRGYEVATTAPRFCFVIQQVSTGEESRSAYGIYATCMQHVCSIYAIVMVTYVAIFGYTCQYRTFTLIFLKNVCVHSNMRLDWGPQRQSQRRQCCLIPFYFILTEAERKLIIDNVARENSSNSLFSMHIAPTTYSWGKTNILGHQIMDIMSSLVFRWI